MPNWCDNSVTIYNNDKSKIDAIEATLKSDEPKLFHTILPMPDSEAENWYNWNCGNWGSKWDASIVDWGRNDDNEIWVSFESAWSPPIALYDYMHMNDYDVRAIYNEPGMGFAGLYEGGNDDYYEYNITDRESIDALPPELIDYADLEYQHEQWLEEQQESEE